jgi:hypothetical protein
MRRCSFRLDLEEWASSMEDFFQVAIQDLRPGLQ